MTIEEINKRLAAIESEKGDDETQHILEDTLFSDFIAYVSSIDARSDAYLGVKAAQVLKSRDINFSRWCA